MASVASANKGKVPESPKSMSSATNYIGRGSRLGTRNTGNMASAIRSNLTPPNLGRNPNRNTGQITQKSNRELKTFEKVLLREYPNRDPNATMTINTNRMGKKK